MNSEATKLIRRAYQNVAAAIDCLDNAIKLEQDAGYRQDIRDVVVDVEAARLSLDIIRPKPHAQQSAS